MQLQRVLSFEFCHNLKSPHGCKETKLQSCFLHVSSSCSRFGTPSQDVNKVLWSFEGQTLKVLSESTQIRSLQETKNRQSSCLVLPM